MTLLDLVTARVTGLGAYLLRMVPDNTPARMLNRAAGFVEADAERTADWDAGQPTAWAWSAWPGFGASA